MCVCVCVCVYVYIYSIYTHTHTHTLTEHFIRYLLEFFFRLIKSPAAVAYPLSGLMRCVFRDAFLHTTVVKRGYLHCCHLPIRFDLSGPSPLISLISNTVLAAELLLTGCFLFFAPFSANSRDCVV